MDQNVFKTLRVGDVVRFNHSVSFQITATETFSGQTESITIEDGSRMKIGDKEVAWLEVTSRTVLPLIEVEQQIFWMSKTQLREVITQVALSVPLSVAIAWGWQTPREDE